MELATSETAGSNLRLCYKMGILERLEIGGAEDIDPDRPLELCGLSLGVEATTAAIKIAQSTAPPRTLLIFDAKDVVVDIFELHSNIDEVTAVFSLPEGLDTPLPTALEVYLVLAIHAASDEALTGILSGGCIVSLGDHPLVEKFSRLLQKVNRKGEVGLGSLSQYKSVHSTIPAADALTEMDMSCLIGYIAASPLKFKFLELYRLMEARYLKRVQEEFNSSFLSGPKMAISEAAKSLESEISQIGLLSQRAQPYFEIISDIITGARGENRFAASLCRKLSSQGGDMKSPKHKAGAAFIYYIRCAIVHAGGKDLIFESFDDSGELLSGIMDYMEEAAFSLAGLEFRN